MNYTIDSSFSINEALEKLESGDILYLKNGIYKEKVFEIKDDITIIGESKDGVVIENNDYFCKIMEDHNICNTFRTYTAYIGGKNVTLKNLTIKNLSVPSSKFGQAVALHVDSDNFYCENVALVGAQDTLFTGPTPYFLRERYKNFLKPIFLRKYVAKQVFKNCDIYGDVDFIFGNSTALFYNCNIISISRIGGVKTGWLCAPSHEEAQEYGYLFYKCNIKAEKNVEGIYLARPWGKYGNVAFIDCKLGSHINPEGFSIWSGTTRHETAKFMEYGDYDTSKRPDWSIKLNKKEAMEYLDSFLNNINYKL